jgi:ferredoxin
MAAPRLPVGSFVRIEKPELQAIVDTWKALGYRTVGPRVSEAAVVYDDLDSVRDLPIGCLDEQDGGSYRLRSEGEAYFDYVVGPHSLKAFLFPPRETVLESTRTGGQWQMQTPAVASPRLAVIGPRACDLEALRVQDHVFVAGEFADPTYRARRENLAIVAVNCRRAVATCFCHSMRSGPAVRFGFDLALTELGDHFAVEVGTELGGQVITAAAWTPCTIGEITAARELPEKLRQHMQQRNGQVPANGEPRGRSLDTNRVHELLLQNLEHDRWEQTSRRCLACGNCTLVCPTCFCSNVDDASDLLGDRVRREKIWASCFSADHSYMNSGTVRKSIAARYRQWLTHKLATWIDQFGMSGCVGCGRCITWCPVGIDLTEEVAVIRGGQA